jgi:hypothetical protein
MVRRKGVDVQTVAERTAEEMPDELLDIGSYLMGDPMGLKRWEAAVADQLRQRGGTGDEFESLQVLHALGGSVKDIYRALLGAR